MCPQIEPDFSQAADRLPAGEYATRIVGIADNEVKASKKDGTPYVTWELEVFGKDDDRLNGRKIRFTTMIKGPGSGNLRKLMKACGQEQMGDTEELYGKEVVVVLNYKNPDDDFPEVKSVKSYKASEAA